MSNNVYYTTWKGRRTGYDYRLEVTPRNASPFSAGVPTAVSITNAGTLYTTANNVATTGGAGSGLTLNIQANPIGSIETFTITAAGTGYANNGTYTLKVGANTTASFKVTDVDINGEVLNGNIKVHGTGYAVNDVALLDGGNGDCYITIDSILNGEITHVSIHSAGSGYATNDVVTVQQVLGIGYNTSASVTITAVSSGANYIAFPPSSIKLGKLDVFEFDELPTGLPAGSVLEYELDLDEIGGLGYSELIDAVLFPRVSTSSTFTDTLGNSIIKQYDIGTIHALFIDPNGSGLIEVFTGIQKLGAESGLSESSHLLKIEAHDVVKTATEIVQMSDWKVLTYNNLGNKSNYRDCVIGFRNETYPLSLLLHRVQAVGGDNWYTSSLLNFHYGYGTAMAAVMSKLLRIAATSSLYEALENVTYYKRKLTKDPDLNKRGTALTYNDVQVHFGISSDNGKTFNRGYTIDEKAYGRQSLRDWINDVAFSNLKRPYITEPAVLFSTKVYTIRCCSLIPKAFNSINSTAFTKWELKIGENTYNSIEVACKEKRMDDLDKYVATSGTQSENTKQTSVGLAFNTAGIPSQKSPSFEPRYGTLLYSEPNVYANTGDNADSGLLAVHPQPNISLSYNSTGVASGKDTDTLIGIADVTYGGNSTTNPNYRLYSTLEQQLNNVEAVIGKTLIKLFAKMRWSVEAELGMEYMIGAGTTDDPLFQWKGTPSGFNFDLSAEPYRSYLSGLATAIPTNWVLVKSSVDLQEEIVSARFIEEPK